MEGDKMNTEIHEDATVAQCMNCGSLFGYFRDINENEMWCGECLHDCEPAGASVQTQAERQAAQTQGLEAQRGNSPAYY